MRRVFMVTFSILLALMVHSICFGSTVVTYSSRHLVTSIVGDNDDGVLSASVHAINF